ncbi:hypothetical protein, partial [Synechococcus sp. BDU 130192]|uniref:hypothetical protein n=1 Tax=Synechococcus sp. BDU 130192 TaxID=2042059 RepID=UPI001C1F5621
NSSNIADNSMNISMNSSNIADNSMNISMNSSNIADNSMNISMNSSNIAQNTTDITENRSNIATNSANIAQNTADIAENRQRIDEAFDEIEENSSGIAMALALSSLNKGLLPGKRYGIGVAFGTFKSEVSIAANGTFLFTDPNSDGTQVLFNVGAGFGLTQDTFGAAAGLTLQW